METKIPDSVLSILQGCREKASRINPNLKVSPPSSPVPRTPVPQRNQRDPQKAMTCNSAMVESSPLILRLISMALSNWHKAYKNFNDINTRTAYMQQAQENLGSILNGLRIDIDNTAPAFHDYCNKIRNDMTESSAHNNKEKANEVINELTTMRECWIDIVSKTPKPHVAIIDETDDKVVLGTIMTYPTVDNMFDNALKRSHILMNRAKKIFDLKPTFNLNNLEMNPHDQRKLEDKLQRALLPVLSDYARKLEAKAKEEMSNYILSLENK